MLSAIFVRLSITFLISIAAYVGPEKMAVCLSQAFMHDSLSSTCTIVVAAAEHLIAH